MVIKWIMARYFSGFLGIVATFEESCFDVRMARLAGGAVV